MITDEGIQQSTVAYKETRKLGVTSFRYDKKNCTIRIDFSHDLHQALHNSVYPAARPINVCFRLGRMGAVNDQMELFQS